MFCSGLLDVGLMFLSVDVSRNQTSQTLAVKKRKNEALLLRALAKLEVDEEAMVKSREVKIQRRTNITKPGNQIQRAKTKRQRLQGRSKNTKEKSENMLSSSHKKK